MSRELLRAMTAEAIGAFALVFAGCGAIMVDAKTHQRLPDPKNQPLERVREIRDEIDGRVHELLEELDERAA
jgi:hypothetical protein